MDDLLAAARAARNHAHVPYSGYAVGAAVRGESGRVHAGCNVENAAFPQGQCAEANAIAAAITAGEREIVEVLLLTAGAPLGTPCGGCRQRLAEFAAPDCRVHLRSEDQTGTSVTLGELLPLAFSSPRRPRGSTRTRDAASVIREHAPHLRPRVAIVLGSGLGGFAAGIEGAVTISYDELPGFPRPTVEGHVGRIVIGRRCGIELVCLQGRVHLYEGLPASAVRPPIETLKALGCEVVLLTNAAGSLRSDVGPGRLAVIEDHVNFQGTNPLIGATADEDGDRFLDLSAVYDPELRARLADAGRRIGILLASGVYLATLGPCFETPAEIRAFRALGADLVGMSTVPEAIAARRAGLRVAALSIVTNLAAGMSPAPLAHDGTLAVAGAAAGDLGRLIDAFLEGFAP